MKLLKNAISLIFKNPKGKTLTVKRSLTKDSFPGFWSLPSTYLQENEGIQDAVNRLAREKLGLKDIKILDDPIGIGIEEREKYTLHMEDYEVIKFEGNLNLNVKEYIEMRWVRPLELKELLAKEHGNQMGECTRVYLKAEGYL